MHKMESIQEERKRIAQLEEELRQMKIQDELDQREKALEAQVGEKKFWRKHPTLSATASTAKSSARSGISLVRQGIGATGKFIKKDFIPVMREGMQDAGKIWNEYSRDTAKADKAFDRELKDL